MVIGGIAVIARGVRRMTTDIDATVRGDQLDVASLLKALAKKRIAPRIRDAERFASESLVLLLKHQPTDVEIDVSMAWTDSSTKTSPHARSRSSVRPMYRWRKPRI